MRCRLKINPELRKVANVSGCCRVSEAETSNLLCGTEARTTSAKHDTELGMQHQRGWMSIPVQIFTYWESGGAVFCCSQPRLCQLCVRASNRSDAPVLRAGMLRYFSDLDVEVFKNVHLDLEQQKCKVKQQVFDHHKDLTYSWM